MQFKKLVENKDIKLKEDITAGFTMVDADYFDELYDDAYGNGLFTKEMFPYLKEAGFIYEDESGFLYVRRHKNDNEDLYSLADINYSYGDTYLFELLLKNRISVLLKKNYPDNVVGLEESDITEYHHSDNTYLTSFVNETEDSSFTELFWDYDFGVGYADVLDYISDENLEELRKLTGREDIIEVLESPDDYDLDFDIHEDVISYIVRSAEDGYRSGSCDEAMSDVEDALSGIEGLKFLPSRSVNGCIYFELTDLDRFVTGNRDYFPDILEYLGDLEVDSDLTYLLGYIVAASFEDNFTEPYYGYCEFSPENFNYYLSDAMGEIEAEINSSRERRRTTEESLGEDITAVDMAPMNAKPQKLYYRYVEYNKELSSKSYVLDSDRLAILVGWAENHKRDLFEELERYIDVYDPYETFNDGFDFKDGICLSKIKSSYRDAYDHCGFDSDGYGVWYIEEMFYESTFLGTVPKGVGDRILKADFSLAEELMNNEKYWKYIALREENELPAMEIIQVPNDLEDYAVIGADELVYYINEYIESPVWEVHIPVLTDSGITKEVKDGLTFNDAYSIFKDIIRKQKTNPEHKLDKENLFIRFNNKDTMFTVCSFNMYGE